ncbi:MAG TPA: glycosyltransferase family 4 protein [Burkholderiales bacterium]|nr:glycosyltransferase family 4 protein [Burkholderiales bacterium]
MNGARRVLILVENLPVPFDRRVWQEACTLRDAGYAVTVICPTGKDYERRYELLDDIHVHRYNLPLEADGALGYALEYGVALFWSFLLSVRVLFTRGFDVIHACNPPDLFFLLGGFYKLFGKKFVFDHHDLNPELYEAKFGRRDFFYRLLLRLERWTFRTADVAIATNESYRSVALARGGMSPDRVFVVRSGPNLERMRIQPPNETLKRGKRYLAGYVGVMGRQEGIDLLLHAARIVVLGYGREDVHFALVGGGTSLDEMRELAQQLGIADYVTFTGRVPDEELLAVLNTADVCVNPDRACALNDLSTMNKVLEYMALGKPIVQFDLKEGRASAGEAALYARPDDPVDLAANIVALLDDPARRERMGRLARKRIERELEWRHQAPGLLAAYAALGARAPRRFAGAQP